VLPAIIMRTLQILLIPKAALATMLAGAVILYY
jgi:hypothetical protein